MHTTKRTPTKAGILLLFRLAHFKKHCRKLSQPIYPQWIKDAAKVQGITIKD